MEENQPLICKNCSMEAAGHYCANCGQPTSVGRLTMSRIASDILRFITQTGRGLWRLIHDLTIRPDIMIRAYLDGRQRKYFGPLQYLVVTSTISSFLTIQFSLMSAQMDNPDPAQFQFGEFITRYFNLIVVLTIPLQAFSSWLLFRSTRMNFAEHLAVNTFLSAHRSSFFIVFAAPLIFFFRSEYVLITGFYTLVWITFFTIVYIRLFMQQWLIGILKSMIVIAFMYGIYYFLLLTGFIIFRFH